MADDHDDPSDNGRNGKPADKPLDRDEKVKIDLSFEDTLRALLKTPPDPEKPKRS